MAVAVAGGTGAFFGAGLGQLLQWRRDVWVAAREDKRRQEDADRDAQVSRRAVRLQDYRDLLRCLHELRVALQLLLLGAFAAHTGEEPGPTFLADGWAKVRDQVRSGLSEAHAQVDVSGSAALRETFDRLNLSCAIFVTDVPTPERNVLRPEALEAMRRAADGEPFRAEDYLETVVVTWADVAEVVRGQARHCCEVIDQARGIIRRELDLHD